MTPSQTTSFTQSVSDVHSVPVQLPLLHSLASRKAVDLSLAVICFDGQEVPQGNAKEEREAGT